MPSKQTAEERTVESVVAAALALEDDLRWAAHSYPSGDNSDAPKSRLGSLAKATADLRASLDVNARLAR